MKNEYTWKISAQGETGSGGTGCAELPGRHGLRPCVLHLDAGDYPAYFHRWVDREERTFGGLPGGPYALVEFLDGTMHECAAQKVQFTG